MDKIYRIFTNTKIFGWWQDWSNKPCEEGKNVKCIEYVRTSDAKLSAKDIEDIEYLIEEARAGDPDGSIYPWVAAEFNRKHFSDKK